MVTKYLRSNKGSTLILVLVTLSILSILGTAILGLSVMNYKMKIVDKNIKTSFYLAEAGLEEAYAAIGKEIENGTKEANQYVEENVSNWILEERKKEKDPEGATPDNDSDIINGFSENGSINDVELKKLIEREFRKKYKEYMNGEGDYQGLESTISKIAYSIVDRDVDEKTATVKVVKDKNIDRYVIRSEDEETQESDDEYIITLESDIEHNKITKTVRGTFKIGVPKYNTPYYVKNVRAELVENVLWTKPITTDQNIYARGKNIRIEGDVFAYGKDSSQNRGGIISEDGSGLIIEGNVATNSDVYTKGSGSAIAVKGDIYCNSLSIPKGTSDCSVTVNDGAVNTYDDVDLNGTRGRMEINGPYYGFSDGTVATKHDTSSSIVINSDDIHTVGGSAIKITGQQVDKNNTMNLNIGEYMSDEENQGVYMAGTVYINVDNEAEKYQTGESISIKGNYKAYTEYLKDKPSRYMVDGKYSQEMYDKFHPDKIKLDSYPPLVLVSKLGEDDPGAIDLSNYFRFYNDDYPSEKEIKFGTGDSIIIKNVKYNLGAYITNEGGTNEIHESKIANDDWNINYSSKKIKEYQYFTNKMSDKFNFEYPYNMNLDTVVKIKDRFAFSEDVRSIDEDEVILVNTNRSKDIFLIGSDVSGPPSQYNSSRDDKIETDGDVEGIIVTKGDVYISGKITYTGIIVAEGNIYFVDDNVKVIKHNYVDYEEKQKLWGIMSENRDMSKQFINGNKDVFPTKDEAGKDKETKSYFKFEDLVDIEWQRIK